MGTFDYILITNKEWKHYLEIGYIKSTTYNNIGNIDHYTVEFKDETIIANGWELEDSCKILAFK